MERGSPNKTASILIMNFDWTNLIIQLPLVAAFMFFMLRWQESHSKNTTLQHEYWQQWLSKREETAKREREEWRAFITVRDEQSRIERQELLHNLKALELQLENLTNFTMLTYMHVTPDKNEILENIKKFSDAQ